MIIKLTNHLMNFGRETKDKNSAVDKKNFIELKNIYPDDDLWISMLKHKYNTYALRVNTVYHKLTNQEKEEIQNELIQLEIEINHYD